MKPKTREQNFLAKIAGDTNADLTMVPRTAEEYFLNQIAENGGGSGLPSYTSADEGKVLTIGEGEGSVTTVIVPEQTVTIVDEEAGAALTVDYANVQVNMPAVITINGVEKETVGVYGNTEQEVEFYGDSESLIVNTANATAAFYAAAGTYTVSLTASAPVAEAKWEKPSGSGALIIKATSVHEVQGNTVVLATDVSVEDFLAAFTGDEYKPVYAAFPQVLNNSEISYDTVVRSMFVKGKAYGEEDNNVTYTVRYNSAQNAVFMLITSNVS